MTTPGKMGVTVTLVFADEAHREMWLRQQELLTPASFYEYLHRREHQNLTYVIGPLQGPCSSGQPLQVK